MEIIKIENKIEVLIFLDLCSDLLIRIDKSSCYAIMLFNLKKMQEIERKFLVLKNQFHPSGEAIKITQGYLTADSGRTVRIRIAGEKGFITIKGKMEGITRTELEYEIPKHEAEILLKMCLNNLVEKTRYIEKYKGMIWEVDVFEKENAGLFLAEIELESENQSFEIPPWVGEEITFDIRYYNFWLSKNPFNTW